MDEVCLEIKRGQSKSYTLYFKDEDGVVIDITGYTVIFTVKEKIDDLDSAAKIKKTITTHTDPTNGESQISLTSTDCNLLGNYLYDLWLIDSLNAKTPVMEGVISFKKSVTQTL